MAFELNVYFQHKLHTSSLPLVGRVRVGVTQTVESRKNYSYTSTAGATPTPALPTRGREKMIAFKRLKN
jgi:hypothetical protein